MKQLNLKYILYILILCMTSCSDELYTDPDGMPIPEGESDVTVAVDFQPMATGLSGLKRVHGKALDDIRSLFVLLYDRNGDLMESYPIEKFDTVSIGRDDKDAEGGPTAESKTKRATFELRGLPYGRYYIYAVANIDDLLTNNDYKDAILTVDGLKNIPLTWNNDVENVKENGQMLGYFTTNEKEQPENEPVIVAKRQVTLHSWLRRAASKITISYDGRGLKEGVFVYIKSVQIKDIPRKCYLGRDNNVGREGYNLKDEDGSMLWENGEKITYYEGAEPTIYDQDYAGPRITRGKPFFGEHKETSNALYFYENMQGKGKNKMQDADGDHKLDYPGLPDDETYVKKDSMDYGTYIEVDAYYVSINPDKLGNGKIKYRFMLGQNVTTDYNAKRNYHYKLTLKLNNFANDADWHIEYEEPKPGMITPDPYYISYLYNHSMMYPIKINTGGNKVKNVEARILVNRWNPEGADASVSYFPMMGEAEEDHPWNGFLSLQKTTQAVVSGATKPFDVMSNEPYYRLKGRGIRTYDDLSEGEHVKEHTDDEGKIYTDSYTVERDSEDENTLNVSIPMHTRAKLLNAATGYTGNNLYVAYQRKARVEIVVNWESAALAPLKDTVTIYQVRRIVNPKGIYREHGDAKPFHVVLKRLNRENDTLFKAFPSEGKWRAFVVRSCNGDVSSPADSVVHLEKHGNATYTREENGVIYGETGSNIDFNIVFNPDRNHSVARYAVVRVEYHNYTCVHLIFVRQGDNSDALLPGGAKWHAKNMVEKDMEAINPLDEGSLFKLGNWDQPIDASSNKNLETPWINVKPNSFKDESDKRFKIGRRSPVKDLLWKEINSTDQATSFNTSGKTWRVAEQADYEALRDGADMEEGFGVLYGNDAEETLENIRDVYGYDYRDKTVIRGMRGCFVYNKKSGKSLFFPIGASGYGHRKDSEKFPYDEYPSNYNGEKVEIITQRAVLRYAGSRSSTYPTFRQPANLSGTITQYTYKNGVVDCPLFYDLYMRPGAIYWFGTKASAWANVGWDFNYFSFNFDNATNATTGRGMDACFVRCVDR